MKPGTKRVSKRWRSGLGWGVLALVGLAMLAWAVSGMRGPSSVRRAALAQLSPPPPLAGRNAFQTLWQLPYAIPEQARAAVFAEDVRRWKALAAVPPMGDEAPTLRPASIAEGRYPPSLGEEDRARFCPKGSGCLAAVEADPAGHAELVARHAALLDRIEGLSGDAGIRDPFGYPAAMPLPELQYGHLPLTRYALAFVQGRRDEALDGTCTAIVTWRRLGADSDTLIERLVAAAAVRATYASFFVEMLARLPRDWPLPASCAAAFAPPTDREFTLCDAARGEFQYRRAKLAWQARRDRAAGARAADALPADADPALAEAAMPLARLCSPALERRIRADLPPLEDEGLSGLLRLECVSNPRACLLGGMVDATYDYPEQIQDTHARLRFVALLLRLRADVSDPRPIFERLQAQHAAFGSDQRSLRRIDDGRALCLENYRTTPTACWEVPLPPYFATPESTAPEPVRPEPGRPDSGATSP